MAYNKNALVHEDIFRESFANCVWSGDGRDCVHRYVLPDKASEDEHESDNATDGLYVSGVLAATSSNEVVSCRQRNVLQK